MLPLKHKIPIKNPIQAANNILEGGLTGKLVITQINDANKARV